MQFTHTKMKHDRMIMKLKEKQNEGRQMLRGPALLGKQARESRYCSDGKRGVRLASGWILIVTRRGWLGGADQADCDESLERQENNIKNTTQHKT